jgi:hypothetical protein
MEAKGTDHNGKRPKRTCSFKLSLFDWERLVRAAVARGVTVSWLMREIVRRHFEPQGPSTTAQPLPGSPGLPVAQTVQEPRQINPFGTFGDESV